MAGCASTPGSESNSTSSERASDSYTPVGTNIPRKRSQSGAPASPVVDVDKQALESEQNLNRK